MQTIEDERTLLPGLAMTQRALNSYFPYQPMASWVDSMTGAYRVGRAMDLMMQPMRVVLVQDWHSREVRVLSMAEVATLRPYPAEPIPQPEART